MAAYFFTLSIFKIMATIRPNALQFLQENLNQANANTDSSGKLTMRKYLEREAENDPTFYRWILNDDNVGDYGIGMTQEQAITVQQFIEST